MVVGAGPAQSMESALALERWRRFAGWGGGGGMVVAVAAGGEASAQAGEDRSRRRRSAFSEVGSLTRQGLRGTKLPPFMACTFLPSWAAALSRRPPNKQLPQPLATASEWPEFKSSSWSHSSCCLGGLSPRCCAPRSSSVWASLPAH